MTTAATLSSVEGSFLWKLVTAQQQSAAAPRASLSGEFFIDRNGKVKATWHFRAFDRDGDKFCDRDAEIQQLSCLTRADEALSCIHGIEWWHRPSLVALTLTEYKAFVLHNSFLDSLELT